MSKYYEMGEDIFSVGGCKTDMNLENVFMFMRRGIVVPDKMERLVRKRIIRKS